MNESEETSPGLIGLLERHGIKPTGDSKKDVELAIKFMPESYPEYLKKFNKDKCNSYYYDFD